MRRWKIVPAALMGAVAGGILVKKLWVEKYHEQGTELDTAKLECDLLYTWLLLEQRNIKLEEYFTAQGYQTAAILGLGRIGRRAIEALNDCRGISVAYGVEVDNFAAVHETLTVYRLGDDPLPPADCMVICDVKRVSEKAAVAGREFHGEIVTLAQALAWLLEQHELKPWDGAIRNWPPRELMP